MNRQLRKRIEHKVRHCICITEADAPAPVAPPPARRRRYVFLAAGTSTHLRDLIRLDAWHRVPVYLYELLQIDFPGGSKTLSESGSKTYEADNSDKFEKKLQAELGGSWKQAAR